MQITNRNLDLIRWIFVVHVTVKTDLGAFDTENVSNRFADEPTKTSAAYLSSTFPPKLVKEEISDTERKRTRKVIKAFILETKRRCYELFPKSSGCGARPRTVC